MKSRKILNKSIGRYVSRNGRIGRSIRRHKYSRKRYSRKRKYSRYSRKKSYSRRIRKSPSVSATQFVSGTVMRGNDGHMWKIKRSIHGIKRWVKISK